MRNALALLVAVLALVAVYVFLPTPEERAAAELINADVPPPAPAGAPGAAPAPQPAKMLPPGSAPPPSGVPVDQTPRPPDPPEVVPCVPVSQRIAGIAGEQFAGKVGDAAHAKYGANMPVRCKELEKLDDAAMMAEIAKEFGLKP